MDGMNNDMSLTSSGQAKVLSFEEFTAAQQGGMTPPEAETEPSIETEPIVPEEPISEPGSEPVIGDEPDDVTMLDNPEAETQGAAEEPAIEEPIAPTTT